MPSDGGLAPAPGAEGDDGLTPTLSVAEIRDYQRINAEIIALLDAGHATVKLVGVEGQRLLASGLTGAWGAVVEVHGAAGPEVGAGLNAENLTVVVRGPAADGAGRGLVAGTLVVVGDAGPCVGYAMAGGTLVVGGDAGPRAGLNQSGGDLILLGRADRLAGERQSGGRLFASPSGLGPYSGRGRRGGRFIPLVQADGPCVAAGSAEAESLASTLVRVRSWLALTAAFAFLGIGCSEELGPETFPTTTVTGRIHGGPEPIGGGWIEFLPIDGTVGPMRSAPISPDGTFVARSIPSGRHAVGINGVKGRYARAFRAFNTLSTRIYRRVGPGASTDLDLDLYTEAVLTEAAKNGVD